MALEISLLRMCLHGVTPALRRRDMREEYARVSSESVPFLMGLTRMALELISTRTMM